MSILHVITVSWILFFFLLFFENVCHSVLMKLSHPSIISLSNYFESPKTMSVVLELAGTELFDHVVELGKLTEMEAAGILRTVAAGVQFMHEKNLVHRESFFVFLIFLFLTIEIYHTPHGDYYPDHQK